ncbi:hypothetical protein D3C85_906230 [compost metagenome]
MGLVGGELDVAETGLGRLGLGQLRQRRALRQGLGHLVGDGLGLGAGQVANQGDDHIAGGIGLLVEGAQLGHADTRDGLLVTLAGMGIRVLAVELLEELQAGELAGVLLLVLEAGEHLVLDPRQGVLGEGRCADHLGEELQGGFAQFGGGQAAQAGDRHVTVGAIAELRAQSFEALGDGGDVLAGHALVEHGVGQGGDAWAVTVLAAAGGEGQAQVEHRQLGGFDEQHLGAFGSLPALNLQGTAARGLVAQLDQGLQACGGSGGVGRGQAGRTIDDEAQHAEQGDQGQAEQAVTQAVALTHCGPPRAGHGRRSGDRG